MTYKVGGKTRSESLGDPAALRRVQRQIAEFRKFQALVREFVEINARMCRLSTRQESREGKARRHK